MTKVIFFAHDARDAAVQRRIGSFMAAGAQVVGFTMRRGEAIETPWDNVDLGETRDAAFSHRLLTMAKALPALARHRSRLKEADILYARNLDMLALARLAHWRAAGGAKIVYECLDVHRFLTSATTVGFVLRAIERMLLRNTALVVVSSPAFVREYLEVRHPGHYRALLLENRMPEGYAYGPRPDRTPAPNATGIIRVGWFGNLRCRRSLDILLKAADRLPGRVRIILRGLPTTVDLPDLHARIAGRSNVEFGGRYRWPQDLPELYRTVDLVWAGDFHDPAANSAWLLPNRLYEGGYYGTPSLAPAACETGRWIEARSFGFTLAEPLDETVPDFLRVIDAGTINKARNHLLAAPKDHFVQPLEEVKELLDTVLACDAASAIGRDERPATLDKPSVVMLLTRNPFTEQSGRSYVLRQRISQLSQTHTPIIVVLGKTDTEGASHGIQFVPVASPSALLLNCWRLRAKPKQTWLYLSGRTRKRVCEIVAAAGARLVYVDMLRLAPLVTELPRNVAVVMDYDDLLSRRYHLATRSAEGYDLFGSLSKARRLLSFAGRLFARPLLRSEARRCATYELELLRHIDLAVLTSPKEATVLRHAADGVVPSPPQIIAIPPIIEPGSGDYPAQLGRRLFFLGNLRYAENVVMLRALAEAMVTLKAQGELPDDAELEVIGDHAPDTPRSFVHLPFRFLGRIPDLSVVAGQGIFLAPVTSGSGIKVKILDGMALGCAVVTTPKGNEGLSARPNRDLIVASDPASVLRAALRLRDRPALRTMLTQRALIYLRRSHSTDLGNELSDAVRDATVRAATR